MHRYNKIKFFVVILWLGGIFSVSNNVYHSLYSNLARVSLAKWAFLPDVVSPERYLVSAVRWGERAGESWYRHGHGKQAERILERVQSVPRYKAEAVYCMGQEREEAGDWKLALDLYQEALAIDPQYVEVSNSLYKLAMDTGQDMLARYQVDKLSNLSPEYPVTRTMGNGLILLGYDLGEVVFERGVEPIPITWYWEVLTSVEAISRQQVGKWTYIRVRNRLYQIGKALNLVPNGGFERDLSTMAVVPYGYTDVHSQAHYQENRYKYLISHHRLSLENYSDNLTQVAALTNPVPGLNGMLPIVGVQMKPQSVYVLGGWMRVKEGGLGYLGGVWRTVNAQDVDYWYATEKQPVCAWQFFVSTLITPEDSSLIFKFLALNLGEGEVDFDNLMLFRVISPEVWVDSTR
jgi:tetratricopeptide (TPR) repeat protein